MGTVIQVDFTDQEGIYEEPEIEVEVKIKYPDGTIKSLTLAQCIMSETRPAEIDPQTGTLTEGLHLLYLTGVVKKS